MFNTFNSISCPSPYLSIVPKTISVIVLPFYTGGRISTIFSTVPTLIVKCEVGSSEVGSSEVGSNTISKADIPGGIVNVLLFLIILVYYLFFRKS